VLTSFWITSPDCPDPFSPAIHIPDLVTQTQKNIAGLGLLLPDWGPDGGSSRTACASSHDPEFCANAKKRFDAFGKSVRCCIQKLRNHPEPPNENKEKKKRKK
jgi:hypothetical protein